MMAQDNRRRILAALLVAICIGSITTHAAYAQQPPRHMRHSADMLPGRVGQDQLARGPGLVGFFQPVQLHSPASSNIALMMDGQLISQENHIAKVGMLIGSVYRFRLTQIPGHPGFEIYPTVEVINRLYPPQGLETKFPIPIEISQEELELALDGKLVTRVIYLEDPESALPVGRVGTEQSVFDIGPRQDPLLAADRLGRPMAILRIGSRVATGEDLQSFYYGMPPLKLLDE